VVAATTSYLRIAAIGYPFFGLGLCLYFAAQGAGKVGGPIVAQSLRLAMVVVGGFALIAADAPMWSFFALSAAAMIAMGLATALAVRMARWDGERTPLAIAPASDS
jgi:Na+-driven multidrug efflux pump